MIHLIVVYVSMAIKESVCAMFLYGMETKEITPTEFTCLLINGFYTSMELHYRIIYVDLPYTFFSIIIGVAN